MTFLNKIKLSGKFGRDIYVVSLLVTLSAAVAVFFSRVLIPTVSLLKIISVPVILYLFKSLHGKDGIYFWINLGLSRKEYFYIPVAVEFILFVCLVAVAGLLGNAVG